MSLFEIITTVLSISAIIISFLSVLYTRKQYLSSLKPDLWINSWQMNRHNKEVKFNITNRGPVAHIERIITKSKNLIHVSNPCPLDIKTGESKYFYFEFKGTGDPAKENFKIEIVYTDKDENSYKGIIKKVNKQYVIRGFGWWRFW